MHQSQWRCTQWFTCQDFCWSKVLCSILHNIMCIWIMHVNMIMYTCTYVLIHDIVTCGRDVEEILIMSDLVDACSIWFYRFGPLVNHWTMRFEAKHKYFKHLATVMSNLTNVCYSLALRHQLHQCYLSLNADSLVGEELEIGPGTYVTIQHICT